MVTLSMTLSDSYTPQTTPFPSFCTAFHVFVSGVVDRDFKFGNEKSSLKGTWSGSRNVLLNFTPPEMSLEQLKLENFKFSIPVDHLKY